jgi:serine protease Do
MIFVAIGLVFAAALRAEVVELIGGATVHATILQTKPDQIIVDLGYTVIAIPKNQILKISESMEAKAEGEQQGSTILSTDENSLFDVQEGNVLERSVRQLVGELGEAVVQVRTPGGLGSGFFINEEGFLITNFHVIEGETQISIEVYHQKRGQLERKVYKQIRIVAMNKFEDLALLKIEDANAPDFAKVPLGDSNRLAVGERVFAVGSPLGLERTVTEGIVSTKTREFQGELYLQTTAQINPGNSGGPLFNLRGEVVGVTNMKILYGEGIGFAIPVDAVKFFLKYRDAYAYDTDNPSNAYRYLEPPGRIDIPKDKSETNSSSKSGSKTNGT